ncbi:baseplate J/gp47 family protein [Niveibacterium sp.]|uniref:baseplate J/gp47 family protein n=1 Tax=Niveibacterium sp. TaxID=2017444 RepID=UPI0035AFD5C3
MPIELPKLDDRAFRDIADEAIARIPSHTPEWTNFNEADPGVTLLELFAFMAENMLYRANQIPERNRLKFLQLLGVPLLPAQPARGVVAFDNARGPLATLTLNRGEPLRAGSLPFRTTQGLDVLPVESALVFKRTLASPDAVTLAAYQDLYASFSSGGAAPELSLYETVDLASAPGTEIGETEGQCFWLAMLRRSADRNATREDVRAAIAGKVLTISMVLAPEPTTTRRLAAGEGVTHKPPQLVVEIAAADHLGPPPDRLASWRSLPLRMSGDGELEPLRLDVELPAAEGLLTFDDVDPLEAGSGELPPLFEDPQTDARVALWLRIRPEGDLGGARLAPLWAGINACAVEQRDLVRNEVIGLGSGAPDQQFRFARGPIVTGSVQVSVAGTPWAATDELYAAPPEIALRDARLPQSLQPAGGGELSRVFAVDAEAGLLIFGDGLRGARPPFDATILVDYDITQGAEGNVAAGAVKLGPRLPAGLSVANPIATWGGRNAESADEGERSIQAWLRHRDRAVTAEDFRDLALRTPSVRLARVEVLSAFKADVGAQAGAVTVMVVPASDPKHPDAPRPDPVALRAVCEWLDPRRLVTTDVYVTGPRYRGLWIAVGLEPDPGVALAELRPRVRAALLAFLSPLPLADASTRPGGIDDITPGGWPLRAPVIAAQLLAVVARVPGVRLVNDLLLGEESSSGPQATERIAFADLDQPELLGLLVEARDFAPGENPLVGLRDATLGRAGSASGDRRLPVPFIPDQC